MHVLGVEGAGTQEHAEHVVVAFVGIEFLLVLHVLVIDIALAEVCAAFGVGVPHLVDVVALAFEGALAVVEGYEVGGDVAGDGVAHHEEAVGALVAACEQTGSQDVLAVVASGVDAEVGGASLQPDEFPVEVELVVEALAGPEGGVGKGALGAGGE